MRFPQRAMHRALDSGRAGEVLNEVQNGDEKDAECQTEQSISLPGSLNSCQKRAICSALHSRSRLPTVIWGPPGTGKSTLAAFLIWQLVQNPRAQVLATAPSNTGADVLCAKLAKIGLDESRMLRLNALGRDVKTVPEEIQAYGFTSYVEGRSVFQIPSLPKLQSYRVVVATCICAAHIAEVMRREGGSAWFSHVVVDEAAEATAPCLLDWQALWGLVRGFIALKDQACSFRRHSNPCDSMCRQGFVSGSVWFSSLLLTC